MGCYICGSHQMQISLSYRYYNKEVSSVELCAGCMTNLMTAMEQHDVKLKAVKLYTQAESTELISLVNQLRNEAIERGETDE